MSAAAPTTRASAGSRAAVLALGVAGHLAATTAFAYLLGFLADRRVPRTVDRGGAGGPWPHALAVDLLLLAAFVVPHSVLARGWWKTRLARVLPAEAERSVYSLVAALTLGTLFLCWRPLPAVLWDVRGGAWEALAWGGFWLGWALCAASVLTTNLFELTGLRQAWARARGRAHEPVPLKTSLLYDAVRHPLYLGFLLALWSTPRLTAGHALFAAANTLYILVAVRYEERDLLAAHGAAYAEYRRRVPMLVPRIGRGERGAGDG